MNFRYEYVLHCPKCKEATVLRHQTPSKTDEGPLCQPTGGLPIAFVCRTTGQTGSFCPEATVEEVYEHSPMASSLSPWLIECECAHNNCVVPTSIFAIFDTNAEPDELVELVLKIAPAIVCTSTHSVVFDRTAMKASKLDW